MSGEIGPIAHLDGIMVAESDSLTGRQMVHITEQNAIVVARGYTPVLAARLEAVQIVQDGMADIRRWCGLASSATPAATTTRQETAR